MVDADRTGRRPSRVTITGNRVHDADCGDGVDVRVSGSARLRARINHNTATELREGEGFSSILAFGLQARDRSRLDATLDANRQSALGNDADLGIGPTGADSEGVFVNPVGRARMRVEVSRNRYSHTPGRGGFSANGLEFVSMDDGARARLDVRDSTFSGTPGDVLEQLALGTNAHLELSLDHVVARDSTGFRRLRLWRHGGDPREQRRLPDRGQRGRRQLGGPPRPPYQGSQAAPTMASRSGPRWPTGAARPRA